MRGKGKSGRERSAVVKKNYNQRIYKVTWVDSSDKTEEEVGNLK